MFNNFRPLALCLLLALLLAGVVQTEAQARKPPLPKAKAAATKPAVAERVQYGVVIASNKTVSLTSVDTGLEKYDQPATGLGRILSEDIALKKKRGVVVEPTILVMPDTAADIGTLMKVISELRISKGTRITINLEDGPMLYVPIDPKFVDQKKVRPSPLTLVAALDGDGKISLNNQAKGDSADLTVSLVEIFKDRETNGVFRVGSNEVEKTVFLKIHSGKTVSDLEKFATAVQLSGADRIALMVDSSAGSLSISN